MSTVTALVLLFGYHTSTSSQAAAGGQSSAVAPVSGGTSGTSGTSSGTSGGTSGGSSSGTTGSSSTGSSSTGTSGSAASRTVTGDVADTRWGPVQVQVTVVSGKITNVSVVEYPNNNPRDQEINAQALPILVQETLSAQNAHIDMVSGATVTSDGYLQSLQSALDKAGL
jgi:uncharacterized protein with FMN-binding domain